MEGGGGGGGERSCRDNYNDREHKADEARGGRRGTKSGVKTVEGYYKRVRKRCVCARGFFSFFPFFFPRIPLRIRAKAALYFYVYLFRIGGASVLTREIERLCTLSKKRE